MPRWGVTINLVIAGRWRLHGRSGR